MRHPPMRPRANLPPRDFAGVINLWNSATELAAALDVEAVTVRAWRRRGIPAHYWAQVAEAARMSGKPVDERLLTELGSLRRQRRAAYRFPSAGKSEPLADGRSTDHG